MKAGLRARCPLGRSLGLASPIAIVRVEVCTVRHSLGIVRERWT